MKIVGWEENCRTIDAIVAIRRNSDLSLRQSKELIERVLEGVTVELEDDDELLHRLRDCRFIVEDK